MTERLYDQNSFLYNFTAALDSVIVLPDGRAALVLDGTALYRAGGSQPFETGWIDFLAPAQRARSLAPQGVGA